MNVRHMLVVVAAVMAFVALAFMMPSSDGAETPEYGSIVEPYSGMDVYLDDIEDGSVFYVYKGGSISIFYDDLDQTLVPKDISKYGLTNNVSSKTVEGSITSDATLVFGDTQFKIYVSENGDIDDYPVFGVSHTDWPAEPKLIEVFVGESMSQSWTFNVDRFDYVTVNSDTSTTDELPFSSSYSGGVLTISGTSNTVGTWEVSAKFGSVATGTYYDGLIIKVYYKITYNPNGGTLIGNGLGEAYDRFITGSETIILPEIIAPAGSHFTGWYNDPSGGMWVGGQGDNLFDVYPGKQDNINIYAHFEPDENPVVDIEISGSLNLKVGDQTTLIATSTLADESEDAPKGDRRVEWTVTPDGVYTETVSAVSSNTGGILILKGTAEGTVYITATSMAGSSGDDGKPFSKTWELTVTDSPSIEYHTFTLIYHGMKEGVEDVPPTFSTTSTLEYYPTTIHPQAPWYPGGEFDFLGWSTDPNAQDEGDVDYHPGDTISLAADVTSHLYAVWKTIDTYWTLNFDPNGGSGGPESISEPETGSTHLFDIPGAEWNPIAPNDSLEFGGWAESAGSKVVAVYPGGQYLARENPMTLYAIWNEKQEQKEFRLHYDANEGSGAPDQDTVDYGTGNIFTFRITNEEPERPGYEFSGWSINQFWNDGDRLYTAGETIDVYPGTTTLFAVWTQTDFVITFNPNNGTGGPEQVMGEGTGSVTVTIPSGPDPTRDGYIFAGWSEDPDGAADQRYAPGKQVMITGNITLYAVWIPDASGGDDEDEQIEYQFIFHVDDEDVAGSLNKTVTGDENGVDFQFPDLESTDTLEFVGWNDFEGAETARWFAGDWDHFTDRINDFYPVWKVKVNTWTLSFHPNGGIGGPPMQYEAVEPGATECWFEIPNDNRPTFEGHTLLGWDENPDVQDPSIKIADGSNSYRATKQNTILYAIWAEGDEDTFTLKFDMNGGSDGPAQITGQDVGSHTFTIPLKYPGMDGKIFVGWSESKDGEPVAYVGGTYVSDSKEKTLYAVWDEDDGMAKNFYVIYQPYRYADPIEIPISSNGSGAVHNLLTEDDERFVVRTGYDFVGWSETEGGAVIDGSTYSTNAKYVVLYGKWASTSSDFPDAEWSYSVDGLKVTFDASESIGAVTYYWTITGNGETLNFGLESFEHTFSKAGTYYVTLSVSNGVLTDSESTYITIEDDGTSILLYIAIALVIIVMVVVVLRYMGVF